jgi:peptidoglycan/LPS O-acetylase OafA/YrhL
VLLFFVLSGYLITRLLCAEVDRSGRVDVRSFYVRRGLRLFPALFVLCVVLLVVGTAWQTVMPTLGYYANYARIAGADIGLLTHTWSLAVEEHFYLLWPLVIGSVPAHRRLQSIGALAGLAIVWRAVAIQVMSAGWVYNATDTNAAALLAGCYLAVARPRQWRWAGWAVPVLVGLMFLPVFGEQGSAFHWGGFLAIALGVAAIQHAITRPAWLEGRVVVWLGTISYGLYLWHYVFVRTESIPTWIALPLTVVVAALSWYLVEEPVRRLREGLDRKDASRRSGSTLVGVRPSPNGATDISSSPQPERSGRHFPAADPEGSEQRPG